jgi:transaldolase
MGNYFTTLKESTATRLWVNNPTVAEAEAAIAHGAVGCTTNPTYSANMLKRDRDYAMAAIKECAGESKDKNAVAGLAQRKLVLRIMRIFQPMFEKSRGRDGWVSLQGDPYLEDDPAEIIREIRASRKMGDNLIAKIPATKAGFKAIETLLAENVPILVTEVFGAPQMVYACELYKRITKGGKTAPAFYVTHITGIFNEYLEKAVQEQGLKISAADICRAGILVAKKQYELLRERDYPGIILGGGARHPVHFTSFSGYGMHITINWSTAEQILALNPAVETRMVADMDKSLVEKLESVLPDFRSAWREDGLTLEQFENYGPVRYFRNMFMKGWDELLAAVNAAV